VRGDGEERHSNLLLNQPVEVTYDPVYYSVIYIGHTLGHKKRAEQPLVLLELV
jgi:hypothetical protein